MRTGHVCGHSIHPYERWDMTRSERHRFESTVNVVSKMLNIHKPSTCYNCCLISHSSMFWDHLVWDIARHECKWQRCYVCRMIYQQMATVGTHHIRYHHDDVKENSYTYLQMYQRCISKVDITKSSFAVSSSKQSLPSNFSLQSRKYSFNESKHIKHRV